MAILANIRKRKFVLIAIIALALFAFVVGGSKIFSGNGRAERSIGEINGEQIDYNAFQNKVAQYAKGATTQTQAATRVWNDEVKTALLNEQFDKLGITVGADRLWDLLTSNQAIQGNPNFKDEKGDFSPILVKEFLEELRTSKKPQDKKTLKAYADFEKSLAQTEKETIYNNLIKAGVVTTEKEAEFNYNKENEKVTFKYVKVPYTSVKDDEVKVSDAEIKSYVASHAADFKVEPTRDMVYVKIDEKASLEDEKALKNSLKKLVNGVYNTITKSNDAGLKNAKDLKAFVNEQSDIKYTDKYITASKLSPAILKDTLAKLPVGAIYGPYKDGDYFKITKIEAIKMLPDSAKAAHILISYKGSRGQGTRTEEVAKKLADSLLAVVKANKSKIGKLAKDFSDDKGSGAKEGDLGKFAYNAMVPEFNDFVFEGKKGDVGLVKTVFGYHIIYIKDLIGSSKAYKLATVAKKNLPSKATSKALFTKASKILIDAEKGTEKFEDIAKRNGLEVKPVNKLKTLDEDLPALGKRREIVRWLFDADRKVGDVSKFNVKGGQVIVAAKAIHNETVKSVAEAKSKVYPILSNAKKAKIIAPKMSGTDLVAIAKANKTNVTQATLVSRSTATIPASGKEPKVVGTAFAMDVNAVSKPIIGEKGVYVIQVTKKEEAQKLPTFATQAAQKTNTLRTRAATDAYNAVKDAAVIKDNRATIF